MPAVAVALVVAVAVASAAAIATAIGAAAVEAVSETVTVAMAPAGAPEATGGAKAHFFPLPSHRRYGVIATMWHDCHAVLPALVGASRLFVHTFGNAPRVQRC